MSTIICTLRTALVTLGACSKRRVLLDLVRRDVTAETVVATRWGVGAMDGARLRASDWPRVRDHARYLPKSAHRAVSRLLRAG